MASALPASPHSPLVSVILPAHNAAAYIRQALESVLNQTYRHLEVIVVDDGSTDETTPIVRSLCRQDARVRLLTQPNRGVAAARNRALEAARGEFIAPLDADDAWFPLKIERQVECLLSGDDSVGLVYAWVVTIDHQGKIVNSSTPDIQGQAFLDLTYSNFIGCASTPMIKRSCLERVGGYDPAFKMQDAEGSEDWDLYLRLAERYKICLVPDFLVFYRNTPNSMSKKFTAMMRSHALIMNGIRQRHPEIPARLFRWSASNYCFYILGKSYDRGLYWTSAGYVLQSVWCDPLRLVSADVYLTLVKCLTRIITEPLSNVLWKGREDWDRYWKKIWQITRPDPSVEKVLETDTHRRPATLFKRLHRKRIARLKAHSPRRWAPPEDVPSPGGPDIREVDD